MRDESREYHHPSQTRPRCVGKISGVTTPPDDGVSWAWWKDSLLSEVREGENCRGRPPIYWRQTVASRDRSVDGAEAWTCPECGGVFMYVPSVEPTRTED